MSLTQRPSSSPGLLKKSSRTSLSGQPDENIERRPTPKRSISNLISGLREAQTKMEAIEEPKPLTAPEIATTHFARELAGHSHTNSEAETVVIFHDACYGHRYSRLKTTKTTLSMIVERPERIHASVLGASTAYVRLGGHHAGAKNAPHPHNTEATVPPFKIRRTARSVDITSSYVTNVHGTAWMSELRAMCNAAGQKIAAGAKELSRSATPTNPEKRKLHEGDLYLCAESLDAFQGALGGVADAVDAVFATESTTKRAFVAIRPPGHHCSADYPSGFCWLNNVHVGIEYAAQTYGLTHAAILDFDLHHGDGSQAITWERNSKNNVKRLNAKPNNKLKLGPDIGYYSLHDINSYPCEMGDDEKVQAASLCIDNAHGQSIWNVHLESWKTEAEFWQLYESKYRVLLEKARGFLRQHTIRMRAEGKVAKAAVFISAGFDASEWEGAGMQRHKVNVPTEFYARFTRDVVELAQESDLACDGRIISVLEGGYSDRALCSGVLSHLSGLCAMPVVTALKEEQDQAAPVELDQMMRGLGISTAPTQSELRYDKSWWSAANLTALELKVNPPPPAQARKMRLGPQKTYATPTESFAYKVVDTDKFARSISGTMRNVEKPARPPTPPPPEVDWVVATQELSRLLIPSDRQTRSCTPDDLAPVKAVKKERASMLPTTTNEESTKPRQLRDRKTKGPIYPESTHSDDLESLRSVSRSSRRQTIAELPSSDPVEKQHQRRASRRLSAGSTLSSIGGELDPNPPPLPRPSATTSRPSTATSTNVRMRPPPAFAQGMQVKKTRMPVPSKAKKEAVSSAPVSPLRSTKTTTVPEAQSNGATEPTSNDVDALTSGMKKITIKVGSREDHDRKQKEKIDAERRARALKAAETRKANAAAKKAAKDGAVPAIKATQQSLHLAAKENTAPGPVVVPSSDASTLPEKYAEQPIAPPPVMDQIVPALGLSAPTTSSEEYSATLTAASAAPAATALGFQRQHFDPVHSAAESNLAQSPIPAEPLAQTVPDSAARQLIQEYQMANGTPTLPLGSASSPIRPSSRGGDNVWRSGTPISFAKQHLNGEVPPQGSFPRGDRGSDDRGQLGSAGTINGASAEPSPAVEKEEASVWDVPVTPRQ
jgi:histone deacetylase HOS3